MGFIGFLVASSTLKGTNPKRKNDFITFNRKLADVSLFNTLQCTCGGQCMMDNMLGTSYNIQHILLEMASHRYMEDGVMAVELRSALTGLK